MNKVYLKGNIGSIVFDNGKEDSGACFIFSMATMEYWKDKAGNEVSKTTWHKVTSFGLKASNLRANVIIGSTVFIIGKLRNNNWQKEDGTKSYEIDILLDSYMIGAKVNKSVSNDMP